MPLDRPYCTVSDVQRETKNSEPEVTALYEQCIGKASRMVESICQRDFWFHDYTVNSYLVPRRRVIGDFVILPFPILTLDSVSIYSDRLIGELPEDVLEVDEYYYAEGEPSIHCEEGEFSEYPFKEYMAIRGTFGYPLAEGEDADQSPPPTIPEEVRRATAMIAAAWSGELHKEQVGLDGSRSEVLDMSVPSEARMLLKKWTEVINYAL